MIKLLHVMVIVGCFLLGTLVFTAIDHLMNVNDISLAEKDNLIHGRMEPWHWSNAMWEKYPTIMPLSEYEVLVDKKAFLIIGPVVLGLYYFLRLRQKFSLLTLGVVCLAMGAIPYVWGRTALLYNTVPDNAGPWIALMLTGVLYATAGCLLFAMLGLIRSLGAKKKEASAGSKRGYQAVPTA